MNSNMNKWVMCGMTATLLAALAGCGGGGSGEQAAINSGQGNGSAADSAGKLTLSLLDAGGAAGTVLVRGKPLTATVSVRDAQGRPVANTLVGFNIEASFASMEPASGTVATDSEGRASVRLTPAELDSSGAGLLKVAALLGSVTLQAQSVVTIGPSKLTLKLVTPATGAVQLKAYGSTILTVDVLNDGVPMSGESVPVKLASICAADGKATLPTQVMSLNGRAQVVYRDQGCTQSDIITASAAGVSNTLAVNVSVTAPDAASIEQGSVLPVERAIVIKGAGGTGRTETATVTFKVVDQFGNALANQKVSFTTISTKAVTLGRSEDTTDQAGQVSTTITSGTEPTAVRVQATLANGLTSISDTIAVTTGVAVQSAFSLSAETYNMEGWNYDNVQNKLLLLLADQFGNPVADGTPVVFQTDSAAVGTADRGGCNTVNGACEVALRSQNPRFDTDASAPRGRAGLATVSVSTLNNSSTPLTGSMGIFLSGSYVSRVTRLSDNGASVPVTGTIALTTSACNATSLRLRLSDSNRNPMPSGTNLAGRSGDQMQVLDIVPSTVPSIAPLYVDGMVRGDQGSSHLIVLAPEATKCVAGGALTIDASIVIEVTSPRGNKTAIPITLRYPSAATPPPAS
jgi:hypothetical protein